MTKEPLIIALICWLALVGLAYLTGAFTLIIWEIIKPTIVEISNKNIRDKIVEEGLFYQQTKVLETV